MNYQPLSGMQQSHFTYDGLLPEYDQWTEGHVGGTVERGELFQLLNESQADYEAARTAALGFGPSHFDMGSHATSPTPSAFNDTRQHNERFLPFSLGAPDLGLPVAQPHAGWDDVPPHSAQNSMNPQMDLTNDLHYSEYLNTDFIEGGSIPYSENVHPAEPSIYGDIHYHNYPARGDYGQPTSGQGFTFDGNDRNDIPVLRVGSNGPMLIPNAYQQITASAEEPVFAEHKYPNVRSNVDLNTGADSRSEPAPSGKLASPSYPEMGVLPEQFVMRGGFDYEFHFTSPLATDGEAAAYSPNIPREHDIRAAGTQSTKHEARLGVSGYAEQYGGRNNHRFHKESDSVDQTILDAVFPEHLEGKALSEPSTWAMNMDANDTKISASIGTSKEKQQRASKNVHLEDNTAVAGNNGHQLHVAREPPAEIGNSMKPADSEALNVVIFKRKSPSEKDTLTEKEVPRMQKNADASVVSKEKGPPRKKVKISKDQAIEGKDSGVLTCDICLASSAKTSFYTYNRQADLNCHIRIVHDKTKRISCPHAGCVETFSKTSGLKRHRAKFSH